MPIFGIGRAIQTFDGPDSDMKPNLDRKQQQHITSSRQLSARRAPGEGEGLMKVP